MSEPSKSKSLSFSIIFSAIIISASLVFFAIQISSPILSEERLEKEIEKGIENYIKKEQEKYEEEYKKANEPGSVVIEGDLADDDPFLGDKDAPVTIVEFSDYECGYCGLFYNNTLPELFKTYVDTGKVKFVYRDFPLTGHGRAIPAALAAECVRAQTDDATYFEMHNLIFDNQGDLSDDTLASHAESLGVNMTAFNECFENGEFEDEIEADFEDGKEYGVTGTPASFVNGRFVSGAREFKVFEAIIEEELAK